MYNRTDGLDSWGKLAVKPNLKPRTNPADYVEANGRPESAERCSRRQSGCSRLRPLRSCFPAMCSAHCVQTERRRPTMTTTAEDAAWTMQRTMPSSSSSCRENWCAWRASSILKSHHSCVAFARSSAGVGGEIRGDKWLPILPIGLNLLAALSFQLVVNMAYTRRRTALDQ